MKTIIEKIQLQNELLKNGKYLGSKANALEISILKDFENIIKIEILKLKAKSEIELGEYKEAYSSINEISKLEPKTERVYNFELMGKVTSKNDNNSPKKETNESTHTSKKEYDTDIEVTIKKIITTVAESAAAAAMLKKETYTKTDGSYENTLQTYSEAQKSKKDSPSITVEVSTESETKETTQEVSTESETEETTQEVSTESKTNETTQEVSTESKTNETTQEVSTESKTEETTQEVSTESETEETTQEVSTESETEETTQEVSTESETEETTQEVSTESETEETTQEVSTESETEEPTQEVSTESTTEETTQEVSTESTTEEVTQEVSTESETEETTQEVSTESKIEDSTPENEKDTIVSENVESLIQNEISKEILYNLKTEIKKVLIGMSRTSTPEEINEILVDPAKIDKLLSNASSFAKMGENESNSENTHELYKPLSKLYNCLSPKQKYSLHKLKREKIIENTVPPEVILTKNTPMVEKTVEDYKKLIQENKKSFYKIIENNQRTENWKSTVIQDLTELPIYSKSNIKNLEEAVIDKIEDLKYEKIIKFETWSDGYTIVENK